jgi:hypothetical protein
MSGGKKKFPVDRKYFPKGENGNTAHPVGEIEVTCPIG